MEQQKLETFDDLLAEELKDTEFAKMYYAERERVRKEYAEYEKQHTASVNGLSKNEVSSKYDSEVLV